MPFPTPTSRCFVDVAPSRDMGRTLEIQSYAKGLGVTVGFGVEITVEWAKKEHHLLGYLPDSAWAKAHAAGAMPPALLALKAACAKVKSSRENRNQQLVEWLNAVLSGRGTGALAGKATAAKYFKDAASAAAFTPFSVGDVAAWATKLVGCVPRSECVD